MLGFVKSAAPCPGFFREPRADAPTRSVGTWGAGRANIQHMNHRSFGRVERVAHRGAPREFPENTLAAFERALERGADAIELDVHGTVDGILVVHHDPAIGRNAPAGVRGRRIDSLTWGEIENVELSPGISIASLAQVLDLVGDRATVYVEIKGRNIEPLVAGSLRARNTGARCAVHSFDHDAIARLARLAPDLPRGLLFDAYPPDIGASMTAAAARDVWPEWRLVDRALVDRVHESGGRVIAWTVNSLDATESLVSLGVDGICTDDVRILPVPNG